MRGGKRSGNKQAGEGVTREQPSKAWFQQLRHCNDTTPFTTRNEVIFRVLRLM